jgi:hypothetical protein
MNSKVTCIPETKYHKFFLIYLLISNVIWVLPTIIFLLPTTSEEPSNVLVLALYGIILLPFEIYHYVHFLYYKHLVPTNIQVVTLEKAESSWRQFARFLVEMDMNGTKQKLYTRAIFKVGMFGPNDIGDYSQKKARVGYDAKKGNVVVLEILD